MPVTRQRVQITPQYATGMPTARPMSGAGQVMRQTASLAGQMAAEYGRQMGAVAEDEAKALVRGAVFSTGPNGLPQMPPDPTARMGEIARRTYDAGITEAYAHRLTQALQAQLKEAEAANLYDYDAFQEDAWNRIEAMSADVPEGFGGMFQQIATGLLVDSGASIGMRQSNLQIQNRRASIPEANQMAISTITKNIQIGRDDLAQADLMGQIDYLRNQPIAVLDDATRIGLERELFANAAFARLVREEKLYEANPDQLVELIERFAMGDITGNDELYEYMLPYVEGMEGAEKPFHADPEIGKMIASKLNVFRERSYARAAANKEQIELQTLIPQVMQGAHDGSKKALQALDIGLGLQLGQGPITVESWRTMGGDDRKLTVASVKRANGIPPSLSMYFNSVAGSLEPSELEQAFLIWKDLRDSGNTFDKRIDMSGEVPERLDNIFSMVDDLHEEGGSYQYGISEALQFVETVYTNGEAWDDKQFANVLLSSGVRDFKGVTEENVHKIAHEYVSEVFDGVEATTKEKERAYRLFEMQVASERDPERALEFTRQQMKGTWVNSKYSQGLRTSRAPERHYQDPTTTTFKGLLKAGAEATDANLRSAAESLLTTIISPVFGIPHEYAPDFGADRANASMFEILADAKIREMVEDISIKDPVMGEEFSTRRDFITPGMEKGQYQLRADMSSGVPPVYYVDMYGDNGRRTTIGKLDVRNEYAKMMQAEVTLDTLNKRIAAFDRGYDFLFGGSDAAKAEWEKMTKDLFFSGDENGLFANPQAAKSTTEYLYELLKGKY